MSKFALTVAFVGVLFCAVAPSLAAVSPNTDLIGFVPDVGSARDVVISPSTGLAYVASGQFGLAVVDVSNPSNPVAIGGANPAFYAEHVAVSGSVATLISGPLGMRVVDITAPQAPVTKGSLGGTFRAVAMSSHYAYLAETIAGNPATLSLDVVDLRDPGNPTVVGRLNLGAVGIGGVKASGSVVYVAAGSAGLKVIDVSTPTTPRIIGSVTPAGGANALAVMGHYAYVSTSLTIAVIDVSTSTSPSIVGSVFALGTALAASNGRVYALNGTRYSIIDASVPTSPRLLGSADDFSAQGLDASGNLLFLATPQVDLASQSGGLYVIDTTQPQSPRVLANVFNGYADSGVGVDGGVAVVAAGSLGMRILDVSTPTAPVVVGGISGTVRSVDIVGQYAYFTQLIPGNPPTVTFDVLSIANRANPSVVGALNLGSIGVGILKAAGSLVYLAGGASGFKIIDTSNPQSPRVIGSATPVGGANTLTLSGQYVYVGTSTSMVVVDVALPSAPNILGSVTTTPSALAAASGRVYSISGNQLVTIDVSNPRAPRILNSIGNLGAQGIDASGTTVFLARPAVDHSDPHGGVFVLDASDPTQEQLTEQIIVPGTTRSIVVEGGLVYAGDSASTIDIIKAPLSNSVAGHIRYYGSNLPVSAVSVSLAPTSTGQGSGAATMQSQTDVTGQFAFAGISDGDWQVEPQKIGDTGQAISSVDALSALQVAVGAIPLDTGRLLACDVSGDGKVSAVDALVVLQFKVGLITRFPAAASCNSDWAFVPEPAMLSNQVVTSPSLSPSNCLSGTIGYQPLTESASNQDFSAVLLGDCSANWQPGGSGAAAYSTSPKTPAQVRLGTARLRGRHLRIPLLVQSTNPVQSLDAEIQYDPAELSAPRVVLAGTASSALMAANDQTPGYLALALASIQPLQAGRILVLQFDVRDQLTKAAGVRLAHAAVGNE